LFLLKVSILLTMRNILSDLNLGFKLFCELPLVGKGDGIQIFELG
jgi:hypothetical protein